MNGHRTTLCDHLDASIFYEIKPKGRPKKGKELRQCYVVKGRTFHAYSDEIVEFLKQEEIFKDSVGCCDDLCCTTGVSCENCTLDCECGCGLTKDQVINITKGSCCS